jgi:hypothetical protein
MYEHIGRQGIENPSKDLLVTRDPYRMLRIGDGDLLVVDIFSLKKLLWRLLGTLNKIQNMGTAESRDDKRPPDESIITC